MKKDTSTEQAYKLEGALNLFKRTNFGAEGNAGLKRSERFTLLLIASLTNDQPATTSLVAERLGVTLGAVTHHINALEEGGLVKRTLSSDDRRVTFIALTEKGGKQIKELKQIHRKKLCQIVEYLGPDDTRQMISLITKMTVFMNKKKEG